jgi:hypothetical protein
MSNTANTPSARELVFPRQLQMVDLEHRLRFVAALVGEQPPELDDGARSMVQGHGEVLATCPHDTHQSDPVRGRQRNREVVRLGHGSIARRRRTFWMMLSVLWLIAL